jgi:hypothetical protein
MFSLWSKWTESSHGSSPLWIQHKIGEKRKKERKKEKTLLHTSLFYTLCTTDRVKKSAED